MSSARKAKEIAFHDNIFGTNHDPRRALAKYYRTGHQPFSFYRTLASSYCNGKRLLEYGCGTGGNSLFWVKSGATVTAIDISTEAIKKARDNALREGATVDYHVMDAEDLQFDESSFDIVVGTGILHHLDPHASYSELSRILGRHGHAVFIEPLGHNALINLYRKYTPSLRTEDEHPLLVEDIHLATHYFDSVEARFFNLFTLLAVPFRNLIGFDLLVRILNGIDELVFFLFPFIKKYAWMVVLHLSKPNKSSHKPLPSGVPVVES